MPLSDLLSFPVDRVHEAVSAGEPYSIGTWYLAKNIGDIELSKLGEILGVGSYDELTAEFSLVGEPLPEGPWPQTFPASLAAAIGSLTDDRIAAVALEWSKLETFGGAPHEGLVDYLRGARQFLEENAGPFFLVLAL